jgi:hypothetical protein
MPRTCLACSSPNRKAIDAAFALGEPVRNIAKRVSLSPAGLLRHKTHVAGAIVRATERREISIGESVRARLEKLYQRAEKVLNDTEGSGDGRLALAGIREVRETLAGLCTPVSKAAGSGAARSEIAVSIVHVGEKPECAWPDKEPWKGRRIENRNFSVPWPVAEAYRRGHGSKTSSSEISKVRARVNTQRERALLDENSQTLSPPSQ